MFSGPDLVVASMFIQQGNDWLDVILLDDVQHLRALNQNTIQHLQDSCTEWHLVTAGPLVQADTASLEKAAGLFTWRCLQTVQLADQPVEVITEQGAVGSITSDQRRLVK